MRIMNMNRYVVLAAVLLASWAVIGCGNGDGGPKGTPIIIKPAPAPSSIKAAQPSKGAEPADPIAATSK